MRRLELLPHVRLPLVASFAPPHRVEATRFGPLFLPFLSFEVRPFHKHAFLRTRVDGACTCFRTTPSWTRPKTKDECVAWMQPSFPFAPGAVDSDPGAELSEKGAGFRWRRRWLERPLGDEARRRIRQVFGARGAAMEGVSEADVASMKVVELRKQLKKRGMDTKGCVRDGSRQEWETHWDRNDKRTDDTDE